MKNVKQKRVFIAVVLCILVIFICKTVFQNIESKKWTEDIDYIVTTLNNNNPNMYIKTSKENFYKSIKTLKEDVKTLKDYEIELRLQEILAAFRDAHTNIATPNLKSKKYPLVFKWFKDKLIVVAADNNLKSILGKELIKINDISVKDILKKINKLPSYEIEQNLKYYNSQMITWYYVLKYYGITDNEEAKFTFKDNVKEESINIKPTKNLSYENLSKLKDLSCKKPIRFEYKQDIDNPLYWYRYIKNDKILYFQYNKCDESIRIIDNETKNKLRESIANKNFDKLIIDLRYNSGGNNSTLEKLYINLESDLLKVKTFIFVGQATFSAAIINAVHLKAWYPNNVIVLGEEPGQPLKFYRTQFSTLPNHKINLSCSVTPVDLTQFGITIPEVHIEETLEDYKNGIDPLYEWVKNYKN